MTYLTNGSESRRGSVSRRNDLTNLIRLHNRRLQKLKEQQAVQGLNADPGLLMEIEDIESIIGRLKAELEEIDEAVVSTPLTTVPAPGGQSRKPMRILFLAANPSDITRLRLDQEIRSIDQALRQAEFRDNLDLIQHWAIRVTDLQSLLLRHKPDIVHFSGHGTEASEIILEDETGQSYRISTRALSSLFSVLRDNIRCVVLNACYSEEQARAIAEHIDCVIGMSEAISDASAISFATAFYRALGYGRDVKTAFDLGCVQVDLENLGDQDKPRLLALKGRPEEIVLVDNN
jgi:hypothetical protein